MAFTSGSRLGAYEILALVGAGGMGEVYRARDTRLHRTVAIKVLAASIAHDPQRRERFEREARAISSLSHPHICALYDIADAPNPDPSAPEGDTIRFLVLEYLEGDTLDKRLRNGPLPTAEALRHAIAICGALDKAHRSGTVHRDLKPANVMLTRSGAKLLDFGLAKSAEPAVAASTISMPPAAPANLTVEGTILGTLQYMAPEQVEGRPADARTDIFAFGALLFEMITGRKAFEGKTRASLLGAILKDEVPVVSQVHAKVPAALDRIVGTCLAKDPDERYQSARDLLRDLTWVASGSGDAAAGGTIAPPARPDGIAWMVAAVAVIALIATAAIALRRGGGEVTPAAQVQFTIAPPENTSFGGPPGGGTGIAAQVALSPDGRNIVFVAGTAAAFQIWLRPVATLEARPIAGTEGGSFPFWSPDSGSIGFFAGGKLKKVPVAGGSPIVLCDAPVARGGSWSRDNVILMAATPSAGLMRVSAGGGTATVVTTLDPATGETNHRWPHFLPDGRHFFYTASTGACCPPVKPSTIRIGSLNAGEASVALLQTESSMSYASGHVVFVRDQTLMAQPFDPASRQLKGDAFQLAEHISTEGSRYAGASVSENGTLVYAQDILQAPRRLTWFDRAGHALDALAEAAPYISLALSPEERRVAVELRTGRPENPDIWTIDIARNIPSRLTTDPDMDRSPVWSPDGTRIAFEGRRAGKLSLRQKIIDGTAADESILESPGNASAITPSSWSLDGRFIAYTLAGAFPLTSDIWALPLFGDRKPIPLVQTAEFLESSGIFSPDGRWLAYVTNEGGQPNVSVQPFLRPGGKHQISKDGGIQPAWRADGKELFYLRADGTMMAVSIDATGSFVAGAPQALFQTRVFLTGLPFNRNQVYAVTKNGQRFLVDWKLPGEPPLTVVINWTAAIH